MTKKQKRRSGNASLLKRLRLRLLQFYTRRIREPIRAYMRRRPHRSFQRTRRRDYRRSLELPGYWAFTHEVRRVLWQHKSTFILLVVFYGALNALLIGISSQSNYTLLRDALQETGATLFSGAWGEVGKAGLLLVSGIGGSFAPELSEVQQVYAVILVFTTWLTTVWLLRAFLAGNRPRLRDAIYNSGAPIIPTVIVGLLLIIQLLPITIASLLYGAAMSSELPVSSGLLAMLVFCVAFLLSILSLYWITGTAMALIVVTLPGMYPWQAMQIGGDMVVGRRIRLLLRMVWLTLSVGVLWIALVVPMILLDSWLSSKWGFVNVLQLVPITILIVSSIATVWSASYIYLLYRKVVDDDAAPA